MSNPAGFDGPAWLSSHVNLESLNVPAGSRRGPPTLERISTLMQYLGSPEVEFPAIHITGTNGKTTTVRVLTELLTALGMKVGAYTSPHLEHVNERMSIDGEPIDDDTFEEMLYAVSLVEQSVGVDPSYFDVVTAAAFRWFADEAVDVAVVEVGMGGTWDATNIVDGRVAVVTNVSVDHVEYLGPTCEQIAQEKSGIVKPGSTLVLGETDPAIQAIFEARATRRACSGATSTSACRATCSRSAVGSSTSAAPARSIPTCSCRCTARTRPTTPRSRWPPRRASSPRRCRSMSWPTRSRACSRPVGSKSYVASRWCCSTARTTSRAPKRCCARSTRNCSEGSRTLVVGLLREKDPHEMLAALGVDDLVGPARVSACRRHRARWRRRSSSRPRSISDSARIGSRSRTGSRTRSSAALLATPTDGQIVITGSLYVVGAARSVLVP